MSAGPGRAASPGGASLQPSCLSCRYLRGQRGLRAGSELPAVPVQHLLQRGGSQQLQTVPQVRRYRGLRAAVRLVVTARGALLDGGWAQPEVPRAAPTATRPAARRRDPHLCSALRSPACSAVPDERLAVRGGRRPAGEHPRQGQKSSEGWSSALRGQTESWAVQPEKGRLRGELRAARLRLKGL